MIFDLSVQFWSLHQDFSRKTQSTYNTKKSKTIAAKTRISRCTARKLFLSRAKSMFFAEKKRPLLDARLRKIFCSKAHLLNKKRTSLKKKTIQKRLRDKEKSDPIKFSQKIRSYQTRFSIKNPIRSKKFWRKIRSDQKKPKKVEITGFFRKIRSKQKKIGKNLIR